MRPQQSSALVENQKRIIAATWKLLKRQKTAPKETLEKDIKVVAESQQKVLQRTQMSLRRLTERFSFSDESYDRAVTHLKNEVTHMEAAIEKLQKAQLKEALGPDVELIVGGRGAGHFKSLIDDITAVYVADLEEFQRELETLEH